MMVSSTHEHRADVVIVGAGAAGGAAAIEALEAGASIVGFDAQPAFGGTASRGGAGVSVADSSLQRELGIHDTPELALRDLLDGQDQADEAWARFYYTHSAREIFGWMQGIGVRFVGVMHCEGDSVPRRHLPDCGGPSVMALAWQRIGQLGAQPKWHFSLQATDLVRDGDRVVGVRGVPPPLAEHG